MTTKTKKPVRLFRNDNNLHPALFMALIRDDYDHDKAGDISATGLMKPPRATILGKKYGHLVEKDASKQAFAVMGNSFHKLVEREAENLGFSVVEERLSTDIEGPNGVWKVTCKPDLFLVKDDLAYVVDWKSTGVFGYKMEIQNGNKGAKKDWVQQLNINSYIIKQATGWETSKVPLKLTLPIPGLGDMDFEIAGLSIGVFFRDWKNSEMEKAIHSEDTSYPAAEMLSVDIPLWDVKEQERYIKERLALHQEAIGYDDVSLPLCSPEERWERGEKWAVMKGAAKRAMRLFDSPAEAEAFMATKPGSRVEHRTGRAIRCESYCDGSSWCDFAQNAFNREAPGAGEIVSK